MRATSFSLCSAACCRLGKFQARNWVWYCRLLEITEGQGSDAHTPNGIASAKPSDPSPGSERHGGRHGSRRIAPMHKTGACASSPYRKKDRDQKCRPESRRNVPGCEVMLGSHILDYLVDRCMLCDVKTRNDALILFPIVYHNVRESCDLPDVVVAVEVLRYAPGDCTCCHCCSPYRCLARSLSRLNTEVTSHLDPCPWKQLSITAAPSGLEIFGNGVLFEAAL